MRSKSSMPRCWTVRSLIDEGILLGGGRGGPFFPQWIESVATANRARTGSPLAKNRVAGFERLENISTQILILDDVSQRSADIGGINSHFDTIHVGRFEGYFIQNFL